LAAAVGVVFASALLGGEPAAGAAQVLSAWQEASIALFGAGVPLMVPRDGRLAGYGFTSVITGVAFGSHAGEGDEAVTAAPGDQLVVVALTEDDDDQSDIYGYNPNSSAAYTLVSGTHKVPLPSPVTAALPPYSTVWAVSVPKGSPAVLTASQAGFSQSFDLRAGKRLGSSPLALYRGGDSPETDVNLSASQTLTGTGMPGGPVSITVAPGGAMLVYFKPGQSLSPPPPPGRAWLMVDMTADSGAADSQGNVVSFGGDLGAPNVYLKLGKATIDPVAFNALPNEGPFPDYYAFPVPASLRQATFVVDLDGNARATDQGNTYTVHFDHQVAEIGISFPPLPAPRGTGYLPAREAHAPHELAKRSAAPKAAHSGGGGVPVALIAALGAAVVLVAAAVFAFPRRHRWYLPVVAVGRSPGALLAGLAPLPAGREGLVGELLGLPAATVLGTEGVASEEAPSEDDRARPAEEESGQAGTARAPAPVVRLLGTLEVEGLRRPVRRRGVRRLLVALALSDGPVSVERLRDLVSTDPRRSESADGVHQLASWLRASLPEGAFPTIGAGELGYRLSGVEVDWAVFKQLGSRAASSEGAEAVELALKALSLVRGVPLAHETWEGVRELVSKVETAVENLAADTARAALALRDARSAEAAVRRGTDAVPGSTALWELRLVAAAAGSGYGLERAWGDCKKTLGADASIVEGTYRRLRQGEF